MQWHILCCESPCLACCPAGTRCATTTARWACTACGSTTSASAWPRPWSRWGDGWGVGGWQGVERLGALIISGVVGCMGWEDWEGSVVMRPAAACMCICCPSD